MRYKTVIVNNLNFFEISCKNLPGLIFRHYLFGDFVFILGVFCSRVRSLSLERARLEIDKIYALAGLVLS